MTWRILEGDCRDTLASLDPGSVQTCVTSPPYYGLRDYGHEGQIGLEETPDEFVAALVTAFRAVRRVLADDGTVWLNLGDSYCAATSTARSSDRERSRSGWDGSFKVPSLARREVSSQQGVDRRVLPGVKQKDLIGVPWMVAFALRADGWYLRSDIIWAKPNPMPESVTDRPTKAHEYLFLLSKSPRYFYDHEAIKEASVGQNAHDLTGSGYAPPGQTRQEGNRRSFRGGGSYTHGNAFDNSAEKPNEVPGNDGIPTARNKRSVWSVDEDEFEQFLRWKAEHPVGDPDVWTVATHPFPGAHFATFPPKLIEPCILAGCPEGGTVLDPFAGAGTTGMVALRHGRSFVGCELSPEYIALARDRIIADSPLWNTHAEIAA